MRNANDQPANATGIVPAASLLRFRLWDRRSPSVRKRRAAHMLETAESMSPTTTSTARCQP